MKYLTDFKLSLPILRMITSHDFRKYPYPSYAGVIPHVYPNMSFQQMPLIFTKPEIVDKAPLKDINTNEEINSTKEFFICSLIFYLISKYLYSSVHQPEDNLTILYSRSLH
jgi:hypothetical protein